MLRMVYLEACQLAATSGTQRAKDADTRGNTQRGKKQKKERKKDQEHKRGEEERVKEEDDASSHSDVSHIRVRV
jgi:hypothetical protein